MIATSNTIHVLIRSAGTRQAIQPQRFVTLRTKTHNGRERGLYSLPSYSSKSLDSLNHECHPEQMSLRQIAPAVHPRGRHRVWEILAFPKSTPQTKCDRMDETDYVAAIRIGKGHLFFSRSTQTSLQKCHTVAQGSSKNKKRKKGKRKSTNNSNKTKPNRLSVFPIQRSAQHAAGQQSSRMLYKSAISMSSKGSAGWTKVHSSHCSHVMLASREQNVISITFFPVIF